MEIPQIKNKTAFVIAALLMIPLIYFIVDRIQLLQVGEHVVGVVENVTATNDRCSRRSGKRTVYYDCTKFSATIGFDTLPPPVHSTFQLSGGTTSGHNQPLSDSSRQKGDATKVIYDPKKLERAYEDTIWGIWGVPLMNFFFQITFLISSFSDNQKKTNYYDDDDDEDLVKVTNDGLGGSLGGMI